LDAARGGKASMERRLAVLLAVMVLVVAAVSRCHAGLEHICTPGSSYRQRGTCGHQLTRLLSMVCSTSGYNKRIGSRAGTRRRRDRFSS